jgi:4,5-dihydroxyphthalate decarboxylase
MVQGGEGSMAGHLRRIDKGDRSHVALPVFPLRNFTARDLYVRKGGPVNSPADLIGKHDWVASGSIWYRHFLRFVEVPPESLEWWIGDIDTPRATTHLYSLPAGVRRPPEGRSLSEPPDHRRGVLPRVSCFVTASPEFVKWRLNFMAISGLPPHSASESPST